MLRILLVEDNNADARLTGEVLNDTGLEHEMVWINDGRKAIEHIVADGSYDLFILDLNLPKANGLEILSVVRGMERYRGTPVIMMTGSNAPDDRTMLDRDGALYYMVKPMTMKEIDRTAIEIKRIVLGRNA